MVAKIPDLAAFVKLCNIFLQNTALKQRMLHSNIVLNLLLGKGYLFILFLIFLFVVLYTLGFELKFYFLFFFY